MVVGISHTFIFGRMGKPLKNSWKLFSHTVLMLLWPETFLSDNDNTNWPISIVSLLINLIFSVCFLLFSLSLWDNLLFIIYFPPNYWFVAGRGKKEKKKDTLHTGMHKHTHIHLTPYHFVSPLQIKLFRNSISLFEYTSQHALQWCVQKTFCLDNLHDGG